MVSAYLLGGDRNLKTKAPERENPGPSSVVSPENLRPIPNHQSFLERKGSTIGMYRATFIVS